METEIWRPVKGLDHLYECSNFGNVRRVPFVDIDGCARKARDIRPSYLNTNSSNAPHSKRPYVRLIGVDAVRHVQVCQLVAETWITGFDAEIYDLTFKDSDPANSALDNLRAVPKLVTAFNRRISKITRAKETSAMTTDHTERAPQSPWSINESTHRT